MANLINNMGLQEEVIQGATTDGVADEPNVSMTSVRKVKPEFITKDPSLLRSFPNGGDDIENMEQDAYMVTMLQALAKEYEEDDALAGISGGERMQKLARKHPKSLDNMFGEIARLNEANDEAVLQSLDLPQEKAEDYGQRTQDLINYGGQLPQTK